MAVNMKITTSNSATGHIAKLLRTSEEVILNLEKKMERVTGKKGVIEKIVRENEHRVRKSLIALKKLQIKEEDLQKISVFCMCIGAERDKAHQSRLTSWIAEKLPNAEYRDLYTNIAAHGMPLLEVIKEKIER